MDLVKYALKDGRLKFFDKPKPPMKINSDPLQVEEANLVKLVQIMMVEAAKGPNPRV